MKTEKELKDKCTPEIIKKMCELAEGFEWREDVEFENNFYFSHKDYEWIWISNIDTVQFPLLIHRAVEGWNSSNRYFNNIIIDYNIKAAWVNGNNKHYFKNYFPENLTYVECAIMDCIIEIFEKTNE